MGNCFAGLSRRDRHAYDRCAKMRAAERRQEITRKHDMLLAQFRSKRDRDEQIRQRPRGRLEAAKCKFSQHDKAELERVWKSDEVAFTRRNVALLRADATLPPTDFTDARKLVLQALPHCAYEANQRLSPEAFAWCAPICKCRAHCRDVALLVGVDGEHGAYAMSIMCQSPVGIMLTRLHCSPPPAFGAFPADPGAIVELISNLHDFYYDYQPIEQLCESKIDIPAGEQLFVLKPITYLPAGRVISDSRPVPLLDFLDNFSARLDDGSDDEMPPFMGLLSGIDPLEVLAWTSRAHGRNRRASCASSTRCARRGGREWWGDVRERCRSSC